MNPNQKSVPLLEGFWALPICKAKQNKTGAIFLSICIWNIHANINYVPTFLFILKYF
jgi:hypothetical protein